MDPKGSVWGLCLLVSLRGFFRSLRQLPDQWLGLIFFGLSLGVVLLLSILLVAVWIQLIEITLLDWRASVCQCQP